MTFESIQKFVITPHCIECHGGDDGLGFVNLESYEAAFGQTGLKKTLSAFNPNRSSFYGTLVVESGSRKMPPANKPQLSEQQIQLVFEWINAGANQFASKEPVVRPEPEPTLSEQLQPYFESPESIDYEVVNSYIFQPYCLSCHSTESSSAIDDAILYGANLTSYESIFNPFVPVVKKGDHHESSVYESVAVNQTMPPIEDGYEVLDANLNRLLRLWILNCAVEEYDSENPGELIEDLDGVGKVRTV